MKRLFFLLPALLFGIGLMLNAPLSAQTISVYATLIGPEVPGPSLDMLEYQLIEDGVGNYNNGEWVAVKVAIPSELAKKGNFIYLSYALLDTVELWAQANDGQLVRAYQTGQAFTFDTRPYTNSDFVFPMREGVEVYYLRIYSSKPIVLPFEILSNKHLFKALTTKDFLFGIFVGIILVMILYNLAIFFITRDKSYAYYIAYLLALVITQASIFGYTDRFVTFDWPVLSQIFITLTGAIVAIASVFFGINFLQLRDKAPLFAKLLLLVVILDVIGIFYLIMGWNLLAFHWVNVAALYGSIVAIVAAIKLSRTGFKPAKFFLIAWSVFLISIIIFTLMNVDIIPYNPYFRASMLFGASIEAVLLSVALADRINILRRENEESQERALEMAQENARIIRQQNIILEEKVQLRTEELQGTNEELKVTLINLKEAQAQLVQSEKMASLGILTAGVAHEINNPLNYIQGGYIAIHEELKKEHKDINKEEVAEYLQWIKSGAERATQIVKSLNIYSRTTEDHMENCNLHQIIDDCLLMLQKKHKDRIIISKDYTSTPVIVRGNSGKLQQAILNLLSNAMDAISEEGKIGIETKVIDDEISVTIGDNGYGIPQENLKKVMDPFYTTKPPGTGTGLGLSITQSIIQEHHGNLSITSRVDTGTSVLLRLPQYRNHGK
ncbi:MAG: 7TM diverse intracellular signaling domain-containing protein [Bacteroidia bacterium]